MYPLFIQKVDTAQLRKIQSVDGGLGVPVARNGSSIQSPKLANGTPRVAGGPTTIIDEPTKKLKKPVAQQQNRSAHLPASTNGLDKGSGGERRNLASSTSLKSLTSESSSADASSESKVSLYFSAVGREFQIYPHKGCLYQSKTLVVLVLFSLAGSG